jgi:hypothetical protein
MRSGTLAAATLAQRTPKGSGRASVVETIPREQVDRGNVLGRR